VVQHTKQLQRQDPKQAELKEKVRGLKLSQVSTQTNLQTQLNEQESKLQGWQEQMEERQQQAENEQ